MADDEDQDIVTYRRAFDYALDKLRLTISEAQDYLGGGKELAASGTMLEFDEQAEDVKATLRLFRRALNVSGG